MELIKIWEWKYRECFRISWSNECLKIPKKTIYRTFFWIKMKLWWKIFWLLNWLVNINRSEYEIINKLPKELKNFIPRTSLIKIWDQDIINMEIPMDFDWSMSKPIKHYWTIENQFFWEKIYEIYNIMLDNKLYFCDIFRLWWNIVVQRISENEWKPIIVDLKKLWIRWYLFQIALRSRNWVKRKFVRRFEKFIKNVKRPNA